MALTVIFFIIVFIICLLGGILFHPVLGVIGYLITYIISPASQWWGVDLATMGVRYSLFMGIGLALGTVLHYRKLSFPGKLYLQEILFLFLIGWIYLSTYTGLPSYSGENYAMKLFKVAAFLWMLIRIVDSQEKYELFLWSLILITAYLGWDALGASTAQYGRIDRGVGGTDFAEGNFLAAHFSMVLPFLCIFFLKGGKKQKMVCILAAVLVVNGIVLCRSRGVFLALALGLIVSFFWAPKAWRMKIIIFTCIAMMGAYTLVDDGFIDRMQRINPNISQIEEQDDSSAGRILAWYAALAMAGDYPLGIGQGNFFHYVEDYQPEIPGKDTHNTYLRAIAELGFPGLILILAMILNAFRMLRLQKKRIGANDLPNDLLLHVYALFLSLVVFLSAGMFITETYIEELYWLLMFPVLLERMVDRRIIVQEAEGDHMPDRGKDSSGLLTGGSRL